MEGFGPLEAFGYLSGITAAGIAATEVFGATNNVIQANKAINKMLDVPVIEKSSKALKSMILSPEKAQLTNLSKVYQKSSVMNLSALQDAFKTNMPGGLHSDFIDELGSFESMLKTYGIKNVRYKTYNNVIASGSSMNRPMRVVMKFEHEGSKFAYDFMNLTDEKGRYVRNKIGTTTFRAPKMLVGQDYIDRASKITSFMEYKQLLDESPSFNTGLVRLTKESFERSHNELAGKRKYITNKDLINEASKLISNDVGSIPVKDNQIATMIWDAQANRYRVPNPIRDAETLDQMMVNLAKVTEEKGLSNLTMGGTLNTNTKGIVNNVFTDPMEGYSGLTANQEYELRRMAGTHKQGQIFRPTYLEPGSQFALGTGDAAHFMKAKTLSVTPYNNGFNLMDSLLNSGYGTGMVMPKVQDEAFYISAKLAQEKIITPKRFKIDLSKSVELTSFSKSLDTMINYYRAFGNKSMATLESNSVEAFINLQAHTESVYSGLLDGTMDATQYFQTRREFLSQDIQGFNTFLNETAHNDSVVSRLMYKDLADNPITIQTDTGVKRIDFKKGIHFTGINFDGTQNGISIDAVKKEKMGTYLKTWGYQKGESSAVLGTGQTKRLSRRYYGLNRYITDPNAGGTIEDRINAVQKLLADPTKNKTQLNKIVNSYIHKDFRNVYKTLGKKAANKQIDQILNFDILTGEVPKGWNKPITRLGKSEYVKELRNLGLKPGDPAYQSLIRQLKEGRGFTTGVFSMGQDIESVIGSRGANMTSTAVEMADFLGLNKTSEHIKGNFKTKEWTNFWKAYTDSIFGPTGKDANIIPKHVLDNQTVERLTSDNLADVQQAIRDISGGNLKGNERTFVDLGQDYSIARGHKTRYVPIVNFESNSYIGGNHIFDETQQPIRKLVSSETRSILNQALNDTLTSKSYRESMDKVSRIILNKNNFMKYKSPGSANFVFGPSGTLSKDFLGATYARVGHEEFLKTIQNYGVSADELKNAKNFDDIFNVMERRTGVSTKTFNRSMSKYAIYQSQVEAIKAQKLSESETARLIKETRNNMRKTGLFAFGGRPPFTTEFGLAPIHMVDLEGMTRELTGKMGYSAQQSRAFASQMVRDNMMYGSSKTKTMFAADFDLDPIATMFAQNSEMEKELADSIRSGRVYDSDLLERYGKKGAISKPNITDLKFGDLGVLGYEDIRGQVAEKASIGRMSNLTDIFKKSAIDVFSENAEKQSFFKMTSDMFREAAIGHKQISTLEDVGKLTSIFNPNSSRNIGERANDYLNYVNQLMPDVNAPIGKGAIDYSATPDAPITFKMKDAKAPYKITYNDVKGALRSYDETTRSSLGKMRVLLNRKTYGNTDDFINLANLAKNSSAEGAADDLAHVINMSKGGKNKVGTVIGSIQDASEGSLRKIYKNRAFQIAAGLSVAAMLLRPADSHIKHQEVKEESAPKRGIPRPSEALSPKSGEVYKATPQGYNIKVRGTLPYYASPGLAQDYLANAGIPMGGSIINRSPGVDAQYVKQLQYNNDSLMWNNT